MILGYPGWPSVVPGGELTLHVSTDARRFRVQFFRWTGRLERVERTPWLAGDLLPAQAPERDFGWPAYRFPVPQGWVPGVYIAWLETPTGAAPTVAMQEAAALFVVRSRRPGALLYKLPLCTYHAYNHAGGGCFYDHPEVSATPPGARVSFRRPGGGIGGPVWGAPDAYDLRSPRNCFAHWDAPFIGWLLREGFALEFCTDLDLYREPEALAGCRLLLSAGHDEYWSDAARERVEAFIDGGGRVAIFGANTCWWRVHLVDAATAMVCHQGGPDGALDHWTHPAAGARPEDHLTGLSYRHGGGWWDGPRPPLGYRIAQASHWVLRDTGLRDGDVIGAASTPPLIGYECDGAPLERITPPVLSRHAAQEGTPPGLTVLAAAQLGNDWQELPTRAHPDLALHAACMSIYHRNGAVFNAGTADWTQVLVSGTEPHVATITRNVLHGLLGTCARIESDDDAPAADGPAVQPALAAAPALLERWTPERVVVFRALHLGDMLCCVPALRALRAALPRAHITLVGLPWAEQFARRFSAYVDAFLAFPGADGLPEQPPAHHASVNAFQATVQARRFDLALQLHGDGSRSNGIVERLGARHCAGFHPPDAPAPAGWTSIPYPVHGTEPERLLRLTDHLGAPRQGSHLEFPLGPEDRHELRERALGRGLKPGAYACIHPGARTREKCWPARHFAEVADYIARKWRLPIVLTGSASEAPLARAVQAAMRAPARIAAAPISIGAMSALMSNARLLVCNDTGISHIAAGLRLPSVVIFSKADILRWAPEDARTHRCIWDPDGTGKAEVLEQVDALMREMHGPPRRGVGAAGMGSRALFR
ncbi:MAG: N,N-dimethylformamidase beta subunit family domain-containing protein [Gammaproteobacteria bacterium]